MKCKTNSKKYCMACEHYDYCDKANSCNGECHACDDYDCENNPKFNNQEVFEMEKKPIKVAELYTLCNKEKLFTCGSAEQYSKMFEIAGNGVTQTELSYILYICSDYTLDVIHKMITPLFNKKEN